MRNKVDNVADELRFYMNYNYKVTEVKNGVFEVVVDGKTYEITTRSKKKG